jgi:ketosteroid isomerase-like protein
MSTFVQRLLMPVLLVLFGFSSMALADEGAERIALEAAAQSWIKAFNAHDLDALVALSTQDVVLMDAAAAASVSGRKAARGAWAHALAAAPGQVTTSTKEAVITGDIAWRIGAFASKLPNGNIVSQGQSLEIWKLVNGQWKIHRQMTSNLLGPNKLFRRPSPSEPILDTPR